MALNANYHPPSPQTHRSPSSVATARSARLLDLYTAVITIVVNEDGTLTPDTTAPNTGAQLLDLKSPLVPLSLAGLALAAVAARRYLK